MKDKTFFIKLETSNAVLLNQIDETIVEAFLFGSNCCNGKDNALMIESTIEYIITTERFTASCPVLDLTDFKYLVA